MTVLRFPGNYAIEGIDSRGAPGSISFTPIRPAERSLMARLGRMDPRRLPSLDTRRLAPPPKTAAPLYQSPEYRVWRETVIARAGRRCEATTRENRRCAKAEPRHRMYADHKHEVRDGGALFDPANGECLCASHHAAKTAHARAARR